MSDEKKLEELRQGALKTVAERFHSSKILEQYEGLYEQLLTKDEEE